MTSICSLHYYEDPDCAICSATGADLFGEAEWNAAIARAEEAGTYDCDCGFTYYKTVESCPLCHAERKIIIP